MILDTLRSIDKSLLIYTYSKIKGHKKTLVLLNERDYFNFN